MSGSGGYYKYRCKYFLTHNCPNWVWVNNATCASCLVSLKCETIDPKPFSKKRQADGRDSDAAGKSSRLCLSREIYVPQLENGFLQYTMMEIVAADGADRGRAVGSLPDLPPQPFHVASGISAKTVAAIHEINIQRLKVDGRRNGTN